MISLVLSLLMALVVIFFGFIALMYAFSYVVENWEWAVVIVMFLVFMMIY